MDFSKRVYDNSFHIDPIVRSLLDIDFYKLLMHQFIGEYYPNIDVSFSVTNRTKSVKLTDFINIEELRAQLDYVRTLKFTPNEVIWLRGQTFYGQRGLFKENYISKLKNFQLPEYELDIERDPTQPSHGWTDNPTGQYVIKFHGTWFETTMWEIYALTIINEMRYRSLMKNMSKSELDIMYARAKVKLYSKLEKLVNAGVPNITDFGTRRRHSFLWQEHCVLTAAEVLGDAFTGTSNAHLAMKHGLDAKGTSAHELPMVLAALSETNSELRDSQYKVLDQWQESYNGGLRVFLPDTFGTTQFLKNAPDWVADWTGARPDSKNPEDAGQELIEYWHDHGKDPKDKLIIFSDGLDVDLENIPFVSNDIVNIYYTFRDHVGVGFGFGTNFTNDFRGCHPKLPDLMKPISLVCKVDMVNGKHSVKLSDNAQKRTSSSNEEIDRYVKVFGAEGVDNISVMV